MKMTTLLNKNDFLSDTTVITIDDDGEVSEINGNDEKDNLSNLSKCISVQEESDIIQLIDASEIQLDKTGKRNASDKISQRKRPKIDKNASGKNSNKILTSKIAQSRKMYAFFENNCDYYLESEKPNPCLKLNELQSHGDVIVTAIEIVKSCNQTLEQFLSEKNLLEQETKNVFEKFITNCRTACAANMCLDIELKKGLVMSLSCEYPELNLKAAGYNIISSMNAITSASKYDSQISEANFKYLRDVAASVVDNAWALKKRGWQVKEVTDEIRIGFFRDGKPIYPLPCFSTQAVGKQIPLAKSKKVTLSARGSKNSKAVAENKTGAPIFKVDKSAAESIKSVFQALGIVNPICGSQSNSTFANKNGLSSVPNIVSAAAGSASSQIRNEQSSNFPIAVSAGCPANVMKIESLPKIQKISETIAPASVCSSVFYKENKSGTRFVSPLLPNPNSVITKTLLKQNINAPPNLSPTANIFDRNDRVVPTKAIENNQLIFKQVTNARGNSVSTDLILGFFDYGNNHCQGFNEVNQPLVNIQRNGNGNTLRTLADNNGNYLESDHGNRNFQHSRRSRWSPNNLAVPLLANRLRPIAIDGSNVAFSHGTINHKFSCRGIELCVQHFLRLGHTTVKAFVPHYRTRKAADVVNREILHKLGDQQIVVFTPSREIDGKMIVCYDDRFILDYAVETGAVIVSNDNYRDLLKESPKYNFVIKNRLLMYTFVEDLFFIPKDPLGRHGPNLDAYLRF